MALKHYEENRSELPLSQRVVAEESAFEGLTVACSELFEIIIRWFFALFFRRNKKRNDSIGFSRPRAELKSFCELDSKVDTRLGVARYNKSVEKASASHRK